MALRLTNKHPLDKKFRMLEEFMMENKISVEWNGYRMVFMDAETGEEAIVKELDGGQDVMELPYFTETKLIQEND